MSQTLMQAVTVLGPGGPDRLALIERAVPVPAAGEVLVRVARAGVNRHDTGQRRRGHAPPGATDIPGLEIAGEVVQCGSAVRRFAVGDRVCALVNGGGYAQYCLADERTCLAMPAEMSFAAAASLPEALYTLWHNLIELCSLMRGEWLLIHGGTSGVGSIGIQFARWLGVPVIATCGSDDKCAVAQSLGAFAVCNYRDADFVPWVMQVTEGHGADVILDMAGGRYAERNLQALAMDGRVTHLTSAGEPTYQIALESLMRKRARITGSLLRPLAIERKARITEAIEAQLWPQVGALIQPCFDREFDLGDASAAHERIEAGLTIGKILLRPWS